MSTQILMPLMGEGVHEATVVTWFKKPGDKVEKDEPLLEVSTDKVDTEIPAPNSGYLLAVLANQGDVIEVDQVIAHIGETPDTKISEDGRSSNPKIDSPSSEQNSRNTSSQANPTRLSAKGASGFSSPVPIETAGSVRSSPLARKRARELGVDLRMVQGSALHGRITSEDLDNFLTGSASSRIPKALNTKQDETDLLRPKTVTKDGVETLEGVVVKRQTMSKMRKLIAEHMVRSVRTSPHVTTTIEIDLSKIVDYRKNHQQAFTEQHGFKLTFTPFFIEAAVHGIKKDMILNSSVDGDDILMKEDINIGCAVAIDEGLIVPVIKKAQNMALSEIASSLNDLASRARSKKLQPSEVNGGTFSVTNPGMFGCINSSPIINQPQVAIMSVGAMIRRPVVLDNDEIAIRPIGTIGITFDHRVVDGEGGAKFLANMKKFMESYEG